MFASAGSAVSSAVSSTQPVPAGGWNSTPPLSSATGARIETLSPGRARAAQREAGPRSPCSAKSTSTCGGSCRTPLMV